MRWYLTGFGVILFLTVACVPLLWEQVDLCRICGAARQSYHLVGIRWTGAPRPSPCPDLLTVVGACRSHDWVFSSAVCRFPPARACGRDRAHLQELRLLDVLAKDQPEAVRRLHASLLNLEPRNRKAYREWSDGFAAALEAGLDVE